jgi:hypothetical protein
LAFKDKIRDRQESSGNPIQKRLLQHMEVFKKESLSYMMDYIKDFKDLQEFRPAIKFNVVQNTPTTHHYYKQQILWIAQERDYWVDLHPPRSWVKLEIRNGGKSEIVVVFHCIGGRDSGTGVAVAFLDRPQVEMSLEVQGGRRGAGCGGHAPPRPHFLFQAQAV